MKAQPLFFGASEAPLFGWLHPAAGRLGLVICNPFGYEAVCAHRSLRHFAEAAALAGVPTLRFDYHGTGDSSGDDRDPDRLVAWIASIHSAIDTLKSNSGVEQVCLLGVRLGALLASVAASERSDVTGLIAIAPVISGRLYLRELHARHRTLDLAADPAFAEGTEPAHLTEALGFAISPETASALSLLDATRHEPPPAPEVLVLDRDDLPAADRWVKRLGELGVAVQAHKVSGYVEMMLDPHDAKIPDAFIRATVAWLAPRVETGRLQRPAISNQARTAPGVRERCLFVNGDRSRFAMVAMPERGAPQRAILLLNAGAIHRVGPNRLYATAARRWAAAGHLVVRLDLAGIGDSAAVEGAENVVYTRRAIGDIAAVIEYIEREFGIADCWAVGLCSGAYHAFRAAVAGLPLTGVVLINPLTFSWPPSGTREQRPHKLVSEARRYFQSLRRLDAWKKLARGQVNLRFAAGAVGRYAAERLVRRVRELSQQGGRPYRSELGEKLEIIVENEIELRFVFALADPGLALLHHQGGAAVTELREGGGMFVDTIDGPDHTFTSLWSQAALLSTLDRVLGLSTRPIVVPTAAQEATLRSVGSGL